MSNEGAGSPQAPAVRPSLAVVAEDKGEQDDLLAKKASTTEGDKHLLQMTKSE